MHFGFKAAFFFSWKKKKKKVEKIQRKYFARTGTSVVICSKLSLLLQRPLNRNTERAFYCTAQYLQQTNFLQVGHFAHKTNFSCPQGKFWFGYSALLFYNVELNSDNNEAEHENIMTGTSDSICFCNMNHMHYFLSSFWWMATYMWNVTRLILLIGQIMNDCGVYSKYAWRVTLPKQS